MKEKSHEQTIAEERERESRETGVEDEEKAPLTKQPSSDEVERRPERIYSPGGE
jgi:hypothetical protein